jgi:hypothetical protein
MCLYLINKMRKKVKHDKSKSDQNILDVSPK